jgi:hypothetical protein
MYGNVVEGFSDGEYDDMLSYHNSKGEAKALFGLDVKV